MALDNSNKIYALTSGTSNNIHTTNLTAIICANTTSGPLNTTPASSLTICSGNATSLSVLGSSVSWYSNPTGGTAIGTGNVFSTPSLTANTTYYAEASGCTVRTAILITTIVAPPVPVNNTPVANLTICNASKASLSVTSAPSTISTWYADSIGGVGLVFGDSYLTPILNSTTSYWVGVSNGNNCGSARIKITVNVLPVPASPTITGGATFVCQGSTTTITASGAGTLEWFATLNGGSPLATGTSFTTPPINSLSEYYVQSTVNGCKSARATAQINVTPTPAAPTNTTPTANMTKCSGNVTSLSVSGGSNNSWYANDSIGTALATANSFTTPVLFTTTTYYVGGVSSVNSQCVSPRIPITVTVLGPNPGTLSGNQNVCIGSTTTFIPTASGGTWSSIDNNIATVNTSGVVTGVSAGTTTIIFRFTGASGCPNVVSSRDVTVTAGITATISPATATICAGQNAILTASGGGTYAWSNGGGTAVQATFSPAATTTYTVTVSQSNCSATATKTVTVNANPTAAITPATATICAGTSTTLTASGGTSYIWSNGGGNTAAATFSPATTTTYTVTVTNASNCTATATRSVTVNAVPTAAINPATASICTGATQTLTASGGGTYAWSNGLGAGATKPVTPSATTTYTVTVTNANNCSATAASTITINTVTAAPM